MKVFAIFSCLLAAVSAYGPALVRAPAFDSAVITSERLGGNFAYKSVEGHAYAAINPIVQNIRTPVGVSYAAKPIIAPVSYTSPAQIAYTAPAVAYAAPAVSYAAAPAVVAAPAPAVVAAPAPYAAATYAAAPLAHAALPYAAPYPYAARYY